jgi:ketosteroid isomerase-like protein
VEIVRAVIDAFNRGDWETALKDAAPDFEFDMSRAIGPVRGVFKLDQIRGFLDEFFGVWEAVRAEADEFIEAGDQVVTPMTNVHRGRDGLEVKVRPCGVWTIRDGVIERFTVYQERQDALEAVGLSE